MQQQDMTFEEFQAEMQKLRKPVMEHLAAYLKSMPPGSARLHSFIAMTVAADMAAIGMSLAILIEGAPVEDAFDMMGKLIEKAVDLKLEGVEKAGLMGGGLQ